MIGKERSGVFLSYARKDGEEFAAMLRERLRDKASEIVIKQDRLVLEGGMGWWKQLTEAIDSVEFLVLVMTPSSMESEMVRKEWRYARQQGVCVYPVKGAPDSDLKFSKLPRWMSKSHFFDIDKEWESFVAHLRKGCDTPRVPFMAPDLPEYFTDRPNEFAHLKNLLLSAAHKEPVAITTALSGAGGFGKTTLATALCHDEEIIQNFDDGILWVTLGQNPNVMSNLVAVYAALTGERPGFVNEEDAAFQLGQKLEDRTCLLVIDDVWDGANLGCFLRGGKGCARLFTTRIAEIASSARLVNVDEMREAEALSLLSKGVPGLGAAQARVLTRRLGEWPIALELAGAMLRQRIDQGDSTEHAAERLSQILDRKGPQGLARGTGDPRRRTIDRVLEGSLELLSPDDRTRLTDLSIFPEDVAIPLTAAAALWGIDDLESEETAQRVARLSLLRLDLGRGSMRLHDVMRSWLVMGTLNAVELHSRLLDAWPDWMRLPDSYAWRWLTWHLAQAGRTEDLERILWDPLWLQAKLRATDVHALIGDFDQLRSVQKEGKQEGLIREADLLQGALQLSSHILARDPSQFASQLVGRLLPYEAEPNLQRFLTSLICQTRSPWLRPILRAIHPPGTPLLRTLGGHSNVVQGVAVSSDGTLVVSASFDQTVKIWALQSGSQIRTIQVHSSLVNDVKLKSDGSLAISASSDKTLKVWHPEDGSVALTLEGHSTIVAGVAVTADWKRAISASWDNTLIVWDLKDGRSLLTLQGHSMAVSGVAIIPDQRRAISASWDKTLIVWDLETGVALLSLEGHSEAVSSVAVTPDGMRAISGSWDKTLKVWDLKSGRVISTLVGHNAGVNGVAITPAGDQVISASQDCTLKIWDLKEAQSVCTLQGHAGHVQGVAVTSDAKCVVSASADKTLKVWDLGGSPKNWLPEAHFYAVSGIAVTPDGRKAISSSWDGKIVVWDLDRGLSLNKLEGHSAAVSGVSLTPDGRRAVSASSDRTLILWDVETGSMLARLNDPQWISDVVITPDGERVVSCSGDHGIKIWDLQSKRLLRTLEGHSLPVMAAAVTPDGARVISGSRDNMIKVWDLESGVELYTLQGHTKEVTDIVVTPDGEKAITSSEDWSLKIWDLVHGRLISTLERHTDAANGVALSPGGDRLASVSNDAQLIVWDLDTHQVIASFICEGASRSCAFVDHNRILAGDNGGRLYILSLEEGSEGRVLLPASDSVRS